MTSIVTGVVQEVQTRNTTAGIMYNLKVAGKSYGYGKFPPKCKAGDTVTFGLVYRGEYANVDTKNIQVTPGTGATSLPTVTAAPSDTGGIIKEYWENKEKADVAKQNIIERQAALNTAVAFVSFLASTGALPPVAKSKDAEEVMTATLFHYRDLFLAESTGKTPTANKSSVTSLPGEEEEDPAWGGT